MKALGNLLAHTIMEHQKSGTTLIVVTGLIFAALTLLAMLASLAAERFQVFK